MLLTHDFIIVTLMVNSITTHQSTDHKKDACLQYKSWEKKAESPGLTSADMHLMSKWKPRFEWPGEFTGAYIWT